MLTLKHVMFQLVYLCNFIVYTVQQVLNEQIKLTYSLSIQKQSSILHPTRLFNSITYMVIFFN